MHTLKRLYSNWFILGRVLKIFRLATCQTVDISHPFSKEWAVDQHCKGAIFFTRNIHWILRPDVALGYKNRHWCRLQDWSLWANSGLSLSVQIPGRNRYLILSVSTENGRCSGWNTHHKNTDCITHANLRDANGAYVFPYAAWGPFTVFPSTVAYLKITQFNNEIAYWKQPYCSVT